MNDWESKLYQLGNIALHVHYQCMQYNLSLNPLTLHLHPNDIAALSYTETMQQHKAQWVAWEFGSGVLLPPLYPPPRGCIGAVYGVPIVPDDTVPSNIVRVVIQSYMDDPAYDTALGKREWVINDET